MSNEWALIIFTVITQMAVGSFVILGGVHFFAARRNGVEEADQLSNRALLAIGPVVVLGLVVTFFHLGNPLNAPRAVTNFATSWLSREIVFALMFCFLGALFAFMQWRKLASPVLRNSLALLNALVGLGLVYVMSMIYRIPSVPAWNTVATTVTFFITTFLLGAMAMGAAFVANFWLVRRKNSDVKNIQYSMLATSLRWIALISIALLGLQFIVLPVYLAQLANQSAPAAALSLQLFTQQNNVWFVLRLVLLFAGAGLLSAFVYSMTSSESKVRVVSYVAYLAFALVLVSEILGRYLFYASMVRIGI